jgi:hypothetical protein
MVGELMQRPPPVAIFLNFTSFLKKFNWKEELDLST